MTSFARSPWQALAVALMAVALVLPATIASAQEEGRIGVDANAVTAAVQMSQETVLDGAAHVVVLGRSDVFADNLAGAAATGADGPLLLVDPSPAPLAPAVATELERVLGDRSAANPDCDTRVDDVLVLGGTAAISEAVVQQVTAAGYCVARLSGSERVGTSVAVALHRLEQFLAPGVSRGTLLIATAGNPADSAAASAWAAANAISIVVTGSQALDQQVADLIQPGDTAWERIILLGGQAALSQQVEDDVVAAAGDSFDTEISRIAGTTRDDTAFRVATELWDPAMVSGAAIVEGFAADFWTRALPGAAAVARVGHPLLYVQTSFVPDPTDVFLRQYPLEVLTTVGGADRVSEETRLDAEDSLGSGVSPSTQ